MPIAATLLQLAVSRSREYLADETGAHHSHDPLALASALSKLDSSGRHVDQTASSENYNPGTASLFIVHPFCGSNWTTLFSTHPPIHLRIKKLEQLYKKMFS
jgi:heat shock protein HtpX